MKMNCSTCEYQEQCETPFDGSKCIKSRLDKVLAKFDKIEEGYYEYPIKTHTSNKIKYTVVTIAYLDNQFQFDSAKDRPLKLNTVESLIKDLESN